MSITDENLVVSQLLGHVPGRVLVDPTALRAIGSIATNQMRAIISAT